jgi:hypothetical protein
MVLEFLKFMYEYGFARVRCNRTLFNMLLQGFDAISMM